MEEVYSYIGTSARNKIVISQKEINQLDYTDIGVEISKQLRAVLNTSKFSQESYDLILKVFKANTRASIYHQKTLAIKNIGILFEPDLKLNINHLIDDFSKDSAFFICSEGTYEKSILYFLSKTKGKQINFQNISHITV